MNRTQVIDAAELELLVARRQLAQSKEKPELVSLAEHGLRRAMRLFSEAGMTHRAETVWRFLYRLRKRRPASDVITLEELLADYRFGRPRKRGDA